jgi:hypothetical protein
MQTKAGYRPKSTEIYETFRSHYQARKKALYERKSWSIISNLAKLEQTAWNEYVKALRLEHNRRNTGTKFVAPERPI